MAIEPPSAQEIPVETVATQEVEPAIELMEPEPIITKEIAVVETGLPIAEEAGAFEPVRSGLYWIGNTIGSFFNGLFGR